MMEEIWTEDIINGNPFISYVENESSGVVIKKGKGKAEYCKKEEDEAE